MDILIIKNGFQILMDVVIIDPIHIDMVKQTSTMTTHVTTMVTIQPLQYFHEFSKFMQLNNMIKP
jgi:hypothetical protein